MNYKKINLVKVLEKALKLFFLDYFYEMKFKSPTLIFSYFKQLLLLVGLIYAFSNCHIKKSVLHLAGVKSVEIAQKSITQLPVHGSCSFSILQKNTVVKKCIATPQTPIVPKFYPFDFQTHQNLVFTSSQIHPAFEFHKKTIHYPALFIVFKNMKIAPLASTSLA